MKDIRCLLLQHKKKQIHKTKLTQTTNGCVMVYFTWYECERCDLRGIISGDNLGRHGKMEWNKEWSVAPYSSYHDQLMNYQERDFQRMMRAIRK